MRWRNAETPWVTWLVVMLGLTRIACVAPTREYDHDTTTATTTSSGVGTGGSTSGSTTSAPTPVGHDVTAFVSGGVVASNGKHRMVLTVGEAVRAPATMKNTKHRIQGGLVGATE